MVPTSIITTSKKETYEFEGLVRKHSLSDGELYPLVALAGEVGEVCNNAKKIRMAQLNPEWVTQETNPLMSEDHFRKQLVDELGDALFYLTRVAIDNGVTLRQLMLNQWQKLDEQSDKYQRTFLK